MCAHTHKEKLPNLWTCVQKLLGNAEVSNYWNDFELIFIQSDNNPLMTHLILDSEFDV